jgi:hypothetical protein
MARAPRAKRRRETGAKWRGNTNGLPEEESGQGISSSGTTDCRQATSYQIIFTATSLPSGLEKSGQLFSHTVLTVQEERPDRVHIQDGDAYTVPIGLEPQLGRLDRTASDRTTTTTFIASAITRTNTIDLTSCRTSLQPRKTLLTSSPTWNSNPTPFSLVPMYPSRNIPSRKRPCRPCLQLEL